jgi:hypothetical protein
MERIGSDSLKQALKPSWRSMAPSWAQAGRVGPVVASELSRGDCADRIEATLRVGVPVPADHDKATHVAID